MRKSVLAVLFAASVSPAFAASDLVVDSSKVELFYNSSPLSLIMAGYMVPSGTGYILNSTSSKFSGALDDSSQWKGASMPTGSTPIGNLKYSAAHPGVYEYGVDGGPQCVAFVKTMTNTGGTKVSAWTKGKQVSLATAAELQNKAIATFSGVGGTYAGHTAILLNPVFSSSGKLVSADVVDQNWVAGEGRIRKHKMYVTGSGVNNLANYYVVQK